MAITVRERLTALVYRHPVMYRLCWFSCTQAPELTCACHHGLHCQKKKSIEGWLPEGRFVRYGIEGRTPKNAR
eukprot:4190070-Amphidinium_carterae.1